MNSNFLKLCLAVSLAIVTLPSAAQNIRWGGVIDVEYTDYISDLQIDKDRSLVVCGQFSGTVDFDPGPAVVTMTAAGSGGEDIFVAKYDSVGNYLWSHRFGNGFFNDQCDHVALDTAGNVIITGFWNGTADFDPDPVNTFNLTSNFSSRSRFVAKYDRDGNFVAAINMGNAVGTLPSSQDGQTGLGTDDAGNVYVSGFYGTSLTVAPGLTLSVSGLSDNFVAKFNPLLQVSWAFRIGSNETEYSQGMYVEHDGRVIALGSFRNTVDFDPGPGSVTLTQTSATQDGYFASYDSSGQLLFVRHLEAGNSATPIVVFRDRDNHIILSGSCTATMDADPGPGVAPVGVGFNDQAFLAKYDSTGNYLWAFALGDIGSYHAFRWASADSSGNIYVAGNYNPMVDVDPGNGQAIFGNLYGNFVASYDTAGQFRNAFYMQEARMRVVDEDMYLCGGFYGLVDFDPGPQTYMLQSDTTAASWYLLRMHLCDSYQPVPALVIPTPLCAGDSVTLTANAGALQFHWVLPSGLTSFGPTNGQSINVVVDPSFQQGDVWLSADGGCLNSPYSITTLTANQATIPQIISNGDTLFVTPVLSSVQWFLNGTALPAATDTFLVAVQNGNYTVAITDSNGCTGVSLPYPFVNSGISGQNALSFSVMPQPFHDQLKLHWNGDGNIARMQISDVTGRVLYNGFIHSGFTTIPSSRWEPGVYLIQICEGDRCIWKRVVRGG